MNTEVKETTRGRFKIMERFIAPEEMKQYKEKYGDRVRFYKSGFVVHARITEEIKS